MNDPSKPNRQLSTVMVDTQAQRITVASVWSPGNHPACRNARRAPRTRSSPGPLRFHALLHDRAPSPA